MVPSNSLDQEWERGQSHDFSEERRKRVMLGWQSVCSCRVGTGVLLRPLGFASVTKTVNKASDSHKSRGGVSASVDTDVASLGHHSAQVDPACRQKKGINMNCRFGWSAKFCDWFRYCVKQSINAMISWININSVQSPTAAWCPCGHHAGYTPTFLMATLPQQTTSIQPTITITTTCPTKTLRPISMTSASTTRPKTTPASPKPPAGWPTYLTAWPINPHSTWRQNHLTTALSLPSATTRPSKT